MSTVNHVEKDFGAHLSKPKPANRKITTKLPNFFLTKKKTYESPGVAKVYVPFWLVVGGVFDKSP